MHVPSTAPRPANVEPLNLDLVLDDAEGTQDHSEVLAINLEAWRVALVDLLDEARSEASVLNADIQALRAGRQHSRRAELKSERAEIVARIATIETRLRYVKRLLDPPSLDRSDSEQVDMLFEARRHMTAALGILTKLTRAQSQHPLSE